MSEETVVAASSAEPVVMQIEQGPLVNLTSDERTEFRRTGELPKPTSGEAAAPSEAKPEGEAKPAGESEPPQTQEKPVKKPKTADERIAELESTIEKIRKGAGKETPKVESSPTNPESKPEQKPQDIPPTRPKPTAEDTKEDGTPKFGTYEEFVEDLSDWKAEQREAKNDREQQTRSQAAKFDAMVDTARSRYENFDEVVQPTATAINTDPSISPVIKQLLTDSEVLPDFLFTLGSDPAELARFVDMCRKTPGKAIRYIALTESLIVDELEKVSKPAEEAPAKPRTQAPRPPSEAGGRAASPPDAMEAAAKANDFRAFKAESLRRDLAKLKT